MRINALSIYGTRGGVTWVKVESEEQYGAKLCACYRADFFNSDDFDALRAIFTQYDTRALKVRRTRERVILRFLKYMKANASLWSVDSILEGSYYRLARLSEPLQIFNSPNSAFSDRRSYGYFANNPAFAEAISALVARTRAYGARPSRRMHPEPKPMRFKRLWQGSYHSKDMSQYGAKESAFSAEAGNFMMGVELEVNFSGEVLGNENYLYMSEDGSLGNNGAEFVTRPDSAKVHVEELEEFLKVNKLRADHRCGMHVHVAKSMLTNEAIMRIIERVYRQSRQNFTIRVIAKRHTNNYWNFRPNDTGSKYTAVNTRGYRTIEFRLFSGTTNLHLIKRRLQWVNAICKWACGHGRIRVPVVAALSAPTDERLRAGFETRWETTDGHYYDEPADAVARQINQEEARWEATAEPPF